MVISLYKGRMAHSTKDFHMLCPSSRPMWHTGTISLPYARIVAILPKHSSRRRRRQEDLIYVAADDGIQARPLSWTLAGSVLVAQSTIGYETLAFCVLC